MPDIKTEIETKVLPTMAAKPHPYDGLSVVAYVLRFLEGNPGATGGSVNHNRPPHIAYSSPSSVLNMLGKQDVIRRVPISRADPAWSQGRTTYRYWIDDLSKLPAKLRNEFNHRMVRKHTVEAAQRRREQQPELPFDASPPKPTAPSVDAAVKAVSYTPKQEAETLTPGIKVLVTTAKRRIAMDVSEAREVYAHLHALFG